MAFDRGLVSDFDGTMTQRDFYSCAVRYLLCSEDLEQSCIIHGGLTPSSSPLTFERNNFCMSAKSIRCSLRMAPAPNVRMLMESAWAC